MRSPSILTSLVVAAGAGSLGAAAQVWGPLFEGPHVRRECRPGAGFQYGIDPGTPSHARFIVSKRSEAKKTIIVCSSIGNWMQITPVNPSVGPQGMTWHHATTTAGCFYVAGGDSGTGTPPNATFQYDLTTHAWTQYPDLPANFFAPAMAAPGAHLMLVGGYSNFSMSNTILFISTTDYASGWFNATFLVSPSPRSGHRIVVFGGIVYLFGGWDSTQYYNDLWGTDLSAGFGVPFTWVQLMPNNAQSAPPPRNSFTWDVYGNQMILFGGFWHNIAASGPYTSCTPNAQCTFFNDVWIFQPGNIGTNLSPGAVNGAWTQMTTTGTSPPGRYEHASGVVNGHLYIYGGTGLINGNVGALSDLWVLSLDSNTWQQVQASGNSPGPCGSPAGVGIGQFFYMYSGNGQPNSLYAFQPTGIAGAPPDNTVTISTAGLGAGIALSVLATIAVLVFTVLIWRMLRQSSTPNRPPLALYDHM